jgi:RNA-binding protein
MTTPASKPLSGAAIRHLRALGHDRDPVVMIGKEGLTEALTKATSAALLSHELIKVRVQGEAPVDRKEAAEALAAATGAVLAQVLGRTFLLYKRHPKTPKIQLPKPGAPAKSAKAIPTPKAAKDARPRAPHSLDASEKRRDTTGDEDVEVADPDDDDDEN